MSAPTPAIAARDISKSFGAVQALRNVSIDFFPGEIVSVIGENGAGKSTLMKMLAGVLTPDTGVVSLAGRPVRLGSPRAALAHGIAMIHQELSLIDELSAADNIFLGREITSARLIRAGTQHTQAAELLRSLHTHFDPRTPVKRLSIAQKQMVEIARAVAQNARILIMDEPTAVLSAQETVVLFDLMRRLRASGATIIYISHILREVLALSDRIVIMRDGAVVDTLADPRSASEADLARGMVGRPLADYYPPRADHRADTLLSVTALSSPPLLADISLTLCAGEILGFAGLIGSGRTETGEALVGLRPVGPQTRVELAGRALSLRNPAAALESGLAYLSEDRKALGLVLDMPITHNTTLANLRTYVNALHFLDRSRERASASRHAASMNLKAGSLDLPVRSLSGGNQQKVALAKWLDASPCLLILDEPTRGVDVGAKREIYQLIQRLALEGRGIIFISSELPELLGMCHRIAVFRAGRIVRTFSAAQASEQAIMLAASGVDNPQWDEKQQHSATTSATVS